MVSWGKAKQLKMKRAYLKRRATSSKRINKEGFHLLYGDSSKCYVDPLLDQVLDLTGKNHKMNQPKAEVELKRQELARSERLQYIKDWHSVELQPCNAHHRYDMFFHGNEYFVEYRNFFQKKGKRSRVYTDREYMLRKHRLNQLQWVEFFNL